MIYLSITIDNKLQFESHYDNIFKKMEKKTSSWDKWDK